MISIHALLAESDPYRVEETLAPKLFLSTLSLRRATVPSGRHISQTHFYPRSPCGERQDIAKDNQEVFLISIHALLAESDDRSPILSGHDRNFYPRSPCGERPTDGLFFLIGRNFYPRSPCGERPGKIRILDNILDFYPRSPCGERQPAENHASTQQEFLSTLSLRRATSANCSCHSAHPDFYPRSPCGERRQQPRGATRTAYFYPRSPCGERLLGRAVVVQHM